MTCQIIIEGLGAGPPYTFGDQPGTVTLLARASDCQQARVVVRATGPNSPALINQVINVDFSQPPPGPGLLSGVVRLDFPLPQQIGLRCGDRLWIEVICVQDQNCAASGSFRIVCKPAPGDGGAGDGDGDGGDGGDGDNGWWPPTRCMFTAAAAAMALLAALTCIAIGIGTQNAVMLAIGLALLPIVAVGWALWSFWCGPSLCTRIAVLCWVFKRAFIAALPVLFFSTNVMIILVIVGYGSIAGILVQLLRDRGCPVPSARLPLTQIPI